MQESAYIIELQTNPAFRCDDLKVVWGDTVSIDLRFVAAVSPRNYGPYGSCSMVWLCGDGLGDGRVVDADYDNLRKRWLAVRG